MRKKESCILIGWAVLYTLVNGLHIILKERRNVKVVNPIEIIRYINV